MSSPSRALTRSGVLYATPLSVLGTFVYFWLIWVLPAGFPAAAMGTFLAIRVMGREPTGRPLWFWAWRAVAAGAPLGAAGTALWFAVMFMTVPDHLRRVIGPVTAIGAGAGAGVGLIVALVPLARPSDPDGCLKVWSNWRRQNTKPRCTATVTGASSTPESCSPCATARSA